MMELVEIVALTGKRLREAVAIELMALVKHDHIFHNDKLYKHDVWLPKGDDPDNPSPGTYLYADPPHYESDFLMAWRVLKKVGKQGFNVKHVFCEALKQMYAFPDGARVDWPWAMFDLTATQICQAAIFAKRTVRWDEDR